MKGKNTVRMYDLGERMVDGHLSRVTVCVDLFDRTGNVYQLVCPLKSSITLRTNLPKEEVSRWLLIYLTERAIATDREFRHELQLLAQRFFRRKSRQRRLRQKWGRP